MNFTDWYPQTINPARIGFYQRKYYQAESGLGIRQEYWDGKIWRSKSGHPLIRQFLPWRGLKEPYHAPK